MIYGYAEVLYQTEHVAKMACPQAKYRNVMVLCVHSSTKVVKNVYKYEQQVYTLF